MDSPIGCSLSGRQRESMDTLINIGFGFLFLVCVIGFCFSVVNDFGGDDTHDYP